MARLFFRQLGALLWKGLLVRRFYYIATAFEALTPLVIVIGILVFNALLPTQNTSGTSTNSTLGPLTFSEPYREISFRPELDFPTSFNLLYQPKEAAPLVRSFISESSSVNVLQFENATALDEEMKRLIEIEDLDYHSILGVHFENYSTSSGSQLKYRVMILGSDTVKMVLQASFPIKPSPFAPVQLLPGTNSTLWTDLYSRFSLVQAYINRAYFNLICSSTPQCNQLVTPLTLQRMPYPSYPNIQINPLLNLLSFLLPIGCVIVTPLMVLRITEEKAAKAKELLRMIGMSDLVFWMAHFLDHFLLFIAHALFATGLFWAFKIFILSNPFLFALQYILFAAQLTLFLLTLSTLFTKPALAVNIAYIIVSLLLTGTILLLPTVTQSVKVASTNWARLLLCFLPPGPLVYYLSLMAAFESEGSGLTFATISTQSALYLDLTGSKVILCTLVSIVIYCFLIFYLDAVWPFQHGVPKRANFLCTPSYWCPKRVDSGYETLESKNPYTDRTIYETDPQDLNAAIRIEGLTKSFKKNKKAVDGLWLNIYENQITVLLGHNGAGKTTTMNLITGMFGPTSGSIWINGFNIFTQTTLARQSLGLCSQDNVHFKELTVGQHLKLFAQLKNYPEEKMETEITEILELLNLSEKRDVLCGMLSGGMKRKLSLGMALVGGTKTLILDEPSSGMDPDTRRVIWDLLLQIRRSRTILLTTHYMEEADVLGDRIAIMNEGKLSCLGTPLFLKRTFGTGYRLRIAKHENGRFNSTRFLQNVLASYIPAVSISSEVETEVVYGLEAEESKMDKDQLMEALTRLFQDIETHKEDYGIDSFGLSYSTLEDVFLAVGSDLELKAKRHQNLELDHEEPALQETLQLTKEAELMSGWPLFQEQVVGLFLKRFNYARRYWKTIFLQLVIPTVIMIVVVVLQKSLRNSKGPSSSGQMVALDFDVLKQYGPETQTFYYGAQYYLDSYQTVNGLFKANVTSYGPSFSSTSAISERILDSLGPDSLSTYIHKHLYGLGVPSDATPTALWINFEQHHSLPLALNVFYEALLKTISPNASISTQAEAILSDRQAQSGGLSMLIVAWSVGCLSILPNAFLYLGAAYILQPIRENTSKSKLLQLMTGLSPVTFWAVNLTFDLLVHTSIITILYLINAILDSDRIFFDSFNTASAFFALLFSYGLGVIPFAYILSYCFSKTSRGFTVIMQISTYLGTVAGGLCAGVDLVLNYFGYTIPVLPVVYNFLLYIFRFLPIFSALFGYQKLYKIQEFGQFCTKLKVEGSLQAICATISTNTTGTLLKGCCAEVCGDRCFMGQNAWSFGKFGIGAEVVYMIFTGVVCFSLIVAYELRKQQFSRLFNRLNCFQKGGSPSITQEIAPLAEDSDVHKERSRIDHSPENVDLLTVRKLTKQFGNLTAVSGLSFGVQYGETFGLLGVNGAGKTTTFSMLTGDLLPTSGNAFIQRGRYALLEQMRSFRRSIGYCPQFDALLVKMTGEEMLHLFARLRGIPERNRKRDVANLVRMTGLEAHAEKRIDSYSGGTKRKLSIALALVGSPKILFLDEPTSGVDPTARRKIWQTLGYLKRNDYTDSIVLTSHSMEECEALCSRIGILVNGSFCCLGSPQHLRSKYGQGYSVTISLRKSREADSSYVEAVKSTISTQLPSSLLKDYHQSLLHYHVTDQNEKWSNIFAIMGKLHENFDFEDYYVADTTLEQIFIMFARHQVQADVDELEAT